MKRRSKGGHVKHSPQSILSVYSRVNEAVKGGGNSASSSLFSRLITRGNDPVEAEGARHGRQLIGKGRV